jgi:hypothetical protein
LNVLGEIVDWLSGDPRMLDDGRESVVGAHSQRAEILTCLAAKGSRDGLPAYPYTE